MSKNREKEALKFAKSVFKGVAKISDKAILDGYRLYASNK
jgi:hypothetical protein